MSNEISVLNKIARNLEQLGETVTRSGNNVVIENGANDLTISYDAATIQSPEGGVLDTCSPFLGIGIGNPGKIRMEGADECNCDCETIGTLFDTAIVVRVFHVISGHANHIIVAKPNGGGGAALADTEILGSVDMVGLGH